MSTTKPDRQIPLNIGRVVKNGVCITRHSNFGDIFIRHRHGYIFDTCRTVLGGPIKTRLDLISSTYRGNKRKRALRMSEYMIVPYEFAQLVSQFADMCIANSSFKPYAGLSLQEFLMRTWYK
jgi:hypothetical protein